MGQMKRGRKWSDKQVLPGFRHKNFEKYYDNQIIYNCSQNLKNITRWNLLIVLGNLGRKFGENSGEISGENSGKNSGGKFAKFFAFNTECPHYLIENFYYSELLEKIQTNLSWVFAQGWFVSGWEG